MSLAFKQQNKLTVKTGLSAFISVGGKLSHRFGGGGGDHVSTKMIQYLRGASPP